MRYLLIFLLAGNANAAGLTLCNLCEGYTVSKRGNDVLIRCPGKSDPILTFKDCKNPRVTRSGNNVTLVCPR